MARAGSPPALRASLLTLGLVLALVPEVRAQPREMTVRIERAGATPWPSRDERSGSFEALCRSAARSPRVAELSEGMLLHCRLVPAHDPSLAVLVLEAPFVVQMFLAERAGAGWRLVAEIGEADEAPDGHVYVEARLLRMREARGDTGGPPRRERAAFRGLRPGIV